MEFIISAMLTVNSPLRLINSFVPSNGSTKKIFSLLKFILFSSEIIGILGNFFLMHHKLFYLILDLPQ